MINKFKSQPPRLFEDETEYFLTFNTYKRKKILCYRNVPQIIINAIKFCCKRNRYKLLAYVILQDHTHILLKVNKSSNISKFLNSFKTFTSKEIKKIVSTKNKILWQRGTYDHVINDEDDYWNHLDYIHYNPVKHGYVEKPEDWKWLSYMKYVKNKVYDIGWGWKEIEFKSKKKNYSWGE